VFLSIALAESRTQSSTTLAESWLKPARKSPHRSRCVCPRGGGVTKPRSESVLEITHVSKDGDDVNLNLPGTNLEWFRVRTDTLTFVERKPPAGNPGAFVSDGDKLSHAVLSST
jgi:hypothetical protein